MSARSRAYDVLVATGVSGVLVTGIALGLEYYQPRAIDVAPAQVRRALLMDRAATREVRHEVEIVHQQLGRLISRIEQGDRSCLIRDRRQADQLITLGLVSGTLKTDDVRRLRGLLDVAAPYPTEAPDAD
ncbi:MAG: hypothetical protein AAGN46_01335 [Acidobacteriota bacterium]